ncbi:MAG: type I DNA topoisomerase [Prevotellaceae bacterium]|jgi:DNA topoisomerase-1|nr:type I DNA topoisomerase [Prevotellaceae bacterium]
MPKNLVIVESPAKAKTIEKFLGKDYSVLSSFGHIRDLSEKGLGIDFEHDYRPVYVVPKDKAKVVSELKKASKDADTVWLASDEDREGEAISWHLSEVLELPKEKTKRIVFHEITKPAILNAIEHPREIDINLVDAQQARRVLDRIVGFELSPVLWKKIKPSLSAGRVQSVAVRLIVDREREIQQFKPEASYRITAEFLLSEKDKNGKAIVLKAELQNRLKTKEEVMLFLEKCKNAEFNIENIVTKPVKKSPAAPFTTSTLQQEAARKLGFSVNQTMRVAQSLYEAGKITYMRTDSMNLSELALNSAQEEIISMAGDRYPKRRHYHTKSKGAQEAHEAIRPSYMNAHETSGTAQEKRLYDLIWKRTIASQMADAELERTTATINISTTKEKFVATGEVLKFDGFLRVYLESTDEDGEQENSGMLPPLSAGEVLQIDEITAQERFTQKPARYTEASLVRKLEELGIGRPSTYAPTISTVQNRGYVEKGDREGEIRPYNLLVLKKGIIKDEIKEETVNAEKAKLFPTDTGIVVNDFLSHFFPNIMDYNFTASVEKEFDEIAEGKVKWEKTIDDFYKDFHPTVEASKVKTEFKVGETLLGNDPETGKPVSVKIGRYGPVVQIGSPESDEKPRFASLLKGQSIETMTLEEALDLLKLPRKLGEFEGKEISVAVGRFGPYIRHDNKFVSLPKTDNPLSVSYERAVELIESKREEDRNKVIKSFAENEDLLILNGRYGPYISYKKNNYKIPKTQDPTTLTLEECLKLIEEQDSSDKPKRKRFVKK